MPEPTVSTTPLVIEHITINSTRSFEQVRRELERIIPVLDSAITRSLSDGDQAQAQQYQDQGATLSIFLQRDHGALLNIAGQKRHAIQYEIGNPLTASKMTRHQLGAALYAPLRVVLFENTHGNAIFEYDQPSSFFGQYRDEHVEEVGRYLDEVLKAALLRAAT